MEHMLPISWQKLNLMRTLGRSQLYTSMWQACAMMSWKPSMTFDIRVVLIILKTEFLEPPFSKSMENISWICREHARLEKPLGKRNQVLCWCKCLRRNSCGWDFYHTTTTYTPSILYLTLTRRNTLAINTLRCVRYCWYCLHATYTTCTPHRLPHGTSTGGQYHGIGEQKSLSLRQISLRPCGVYPTAYVQTDCATVGWGV